MTNDFRTEPLLLTEETAGVLLSNSYKNSTELHSVEETQILTHIYLRILTAKLCYHHSDQKQYHFHT